MDSKYLITRDDGAEIAGFRVTPVDGDEIIICSECAIDDSCSPPFTTERTELRPTMDPAIGGGEVSPILHKYYDDMAVFSGSDPEVEADLSEMVCEDCSQKLEPM